MIDNENLIIKFPRFVLWLGVISSLFWSALIILMTLFPNDTADYWVYLVFTLFLLLGVWFIWISVAWRVQIEGENIQSRNYFFRTQRFTIKSIARVKTKKSKNQNQFDEVTLYSKDGEELLYLSPFYSGFREFMERLKQEKIEFE